MQLTLVSRPGAAAQMVRLATRSARALALAQLPPGRHMQPAEKEGRVQDLALRTDSGPSVKGGSPRTQAQGSL